MPLKLSSNHKPGGIESKRHNRSQVASKIKLSIGSLEDSK
jgi:hypothetical protein